MLKRKVLSIILSASLIFTSVSFSVFAETGDAEFIATEEITIAEPSADSIEDATEETTEDVTSSENIADESTIIEEEAIVPDEASIENANPETVSDEIEIEEEEVVETEVENGLYDNILRILDQPTDQEGGLNSTVTFSIGAMCVASYQWYICKDGTNWVKSTLASAKSANLAVKINSTNKNYQYRCRITGKDGNYIDSKAVKIILIPAVKITKNPASVAAAAGNYVSFTVAADNVSDGGYQWMFSKDGSSWYKSSATGYNTDTLTLKVSSTNASYQYKCTMLGIDGNRKSSATASIILLSKAPTNAKAVIGETAKFTVAGSNLVSYQWQYSKDSGTKWYSSTAESANSSTFSIKVTSSNINYLFRCKVTDSRGISAYTSSAGLSQPVSPEITSQPNNVHGCIDMSSTFSVGASNVKTYQWQYSKDSGTKWYNSSAVSAKTSMLTLVQSVSNQDNLYRCKLTSADGVIVYTNTVRFEKHNLYYGYVRTSYPGPVVTQEHYIYCKTCGMKGPSEPHKWDVMSETAKCTVCGAYSYPDTHEDTPSDIVVPRALQNALRDLLKCSHPNGSWRFAAGISQFTCPDCGYYHYNGRTD